MKNFIVKNNLYLITVLGIIVAIVTAINWATMPVLQRMAGLFFIAIILHLWEEGRFPGGFTEMITRTLNFTASNRHFGEIITAAYVLFIALPPFFFPNIAFLALAPMLLGLLEAVGHTAAIKLFKLQRLYTPGLVTAVFLLLPISLYSIVYTVQNNLMQPMDWLLSFLYMLIGLLLAQRIVVRSSGMKYSDFLKNARSAVFAKRS